MICGTAEVERIARMIRGRQSRTQQEAGRRFPIGAELFDGGAHFRVWAPRTRAVALEAWSDEEGRKAVPTGKIWALAAEENGYFSGFVSEAQAGMLYKFRIDTGSFPDPASRF